MRERALTPKEPPSKLRLALVDGPCQRLGRVKGWETLLRHRARNGRELGLCRRG
jgi:hypothetical protein